MSIYRIEIVDTVTQERRIEEREAENVLQAIDLVMDTIQKDDAIRSIHREEGLDYGVL